MIFKNLQTTNLYNGGVIILNKLPQNYVKMDDEGGDRKPTIPPIVA